MRVGVDGGGYEVGLRVAGRRDVRRAAISLDREAMMPKPGADALAFGPEATAMDKPGPGEPGPSADQAEAGSAGSTAKRPDGEKLSQDEQAQVAKLRADAEVRAHEAAHAAAAGVAGGGVSYTYATGPDGKQYAIGGEVPVRLAPGRTPEETIRNAARVRAAALAPVDPSAQDRAVAAEAAAMEAAARAAQQDRTSKTSSPIGTPTPGAPAADSTAAPTAGPGAPPTDDPATPAAPTDDPAARQTELDDYVLVLQSEQRTATMGWRHLHSTSGCSTCAANVAAYR